MKAKSPGILAAILLHVSLLNCTGLSTSIVEGPTVLEVQQKQRNYKRLTLKMRSQCHLAEVRRSDVPCRRKMHTKSDVFRWRALAKVVKFRNFYLQNETYYFQWSRQVGFAGSGSRTSHSGNINKNYPKKIRKVIGNPHLEKRPPPVPHLERRTPCL